MDTYLADYCDSLVNIPSGTHRPKLRSVKARYLTAIGDLKNVCETSGINMARPCTASRDERCWIFRHLTLWNEILLPIVAELVEDNPGSLTLGSLWMRHERMYRKDLSLRASITVHWLLKEHHCISTVRLRVYDFIADHPQLFCNALSVSKAVKNLLLSWYDAKNKFDEEFTTAIGNMCCLEKYQMKCYRHSDDSLSTIGRSIGSKSTLVDLLVWTENEVYDSSVVPLLKGAKSCTGLKCLSMRFATLGTEGAGDLADLLRGNRGLEKVEMLGMQFTNDDLHVVSESLGAAPLLKLQTLKFSHCELHVPALAVLVDALRQHTALSSLSFVRCDLGIDAVRVLLSVLKDCPNLRELRLDANEMKDDCAIALSNCLSTTRNLEALSLKMNLFTSRGVAALVGALLRHTSNTVLYLGHIDANSNEALEITRALEADGVNERVQITYNTAGVIHLAQAVSMNSYKVGEVLFDANIILEPEHLVVLFSALHHNSSVKRLSLEVGEFDEPSARKLCSVLSANDTLKYLRLGMTIEPLHMVLLFEGLAKNSSVAELVLRRSEFDDGATRAFVAMLNVNTALEKFSDFIGSVDSLKILGAGLRDNFTLLELHENIGCPVENSILFDIEEVHRRNYDILNKAVKFASAKSTERSYAVAFQKVRFNDSLLRFLMMCGELYRHDAKKRVVRASRYIAREFLTLSGIVKEKLQCHKMSPGVVQIDQLNVECLEKIFLYLRLEDVAYA